jgi:hypothetical protein
MEIASITLDNSAPANVFLSVPLCKITKKTLSKVKFLVDRDIDKNHKATNFRRTRVYRDQANLLLLFTLPKSLMLTKI